MLRPSLTYRLTAIFLFVPFLFPGFLKAEGASYETERAWQESIMQLRQSAETLIADNDRLTAEKEALFGRLTEIQKLIDQTKEENEKLLGEPDRLKKLLQEEEAKSKLLMKEMKDMDAALASAEKANAGLAQTFSRLEEKQKPWEEKIADLTTKKTQLEADLVVKQSSQDNNFEKIKADIQGLSDALAAQDTRGQELKSTLALVKKEKFFPSEEEQKLKAEADAVSAELAKVKSERIVALKDIEVLKKKNAEVEQSNRSIIAAKTKEKAFLEATFRKNEAEKSQWEQMAAPSGSKEERKSVLHESVRRLEGENQGLENRLFDLTEAMKAVKRENAMNEALLAVSKEGKKSSPKEPVKLTEAMAYAYAYHGMYEEAINEYEKALKEGGDKKNINFNLGYIYTQIGNLEEAIKYYKNALKMDPRDEEARRNIIKLNDEVSRLNKQLRR